MLKLIPKHWYSWDFRLEDPAGIHSADVIVSSWRERGAVTTGGVEYRISRQGLRGPFVLEANGTEKARAIKPSAFRQEFIVSHGAAEYTLKRASCWRREFGVFEGSRRIGGITVTSWFRRRAEVTLPEQLPIWLQAFLAWLTALMWKRDAEAAAASAPAGS